MESDDGAYPLTVLIEELRNEDIQLRLNSMRHLKTIALALGPEKTRSQLISFLKDTIYDEDEVLYVAAEQLSTLVPYVGGREYAYSLIPPLEHLAIVEDSAVRDKAVDVLRNLAPQLPTDSIEDHFFSLVHRLAIGHWYSSRSSACALISLAYPRVSDSKRFELRELLKDLAVDSTPMVRRAVAAHLGEIALSMIGGPQAKGKVGADAAVTETEEKALEAPSHSNSGDIGRELGADRTGQESGGATVTVATAPSPPPPPPPEDVDDELMTEARRPHTGSEEGSQEHGERCQNKSSEDDEQYKLDPSVELNHIITFIRPLYTRLLLDEQETVRLTAMDSVVGFIQALGPDEAENHFIELLQHMTSDTSWRLRVVLTETIIDIYQALGNRLGRDYLTPVFIGLLKDTEVEVRVQAVNRLKQFACCLLQLPVGEIGTSTRHEHESFDDDFTNDLTAHIPTVSTAFEQEPTAAGPNTSLPPMSTAEMTELWARAAADKAIVYDLLPVVKLLATDVSSKVRSVLSCAVLELALLIGSELTMQHLLPVLLDILQDECSDVRLSLISNLKQVNYVIKMEHLYSTLLPTITKLASDHKWRVRLAIIEYMPVLADQLSAEVFKSELTELCLNWLVDEVYAIREAAIKNLLLLGAKFGDDWVNETFIPRLITLSTDESYLNRMICLESIIRLSSTVGADVCQQHLLPVVLAMQVDNVPNIRFKVAQALSKVGSRVDQKVVESSIQTCLLQLLEDSDPDVKFYAYEAIDNLNLVPKDQLMVECVDSQPLDQPGSDCAATTPKLTELDDEDMLSAQDKLDASACVSDIAGGLAWK